MKFVYRFLFDDCNFCVDQSPTVSQFVEPDIGEPRQLDIGASTQTTPGVTSGKRSIKYSTMFDQIAYGLGTRIVYHRI